jgi:calcineurin-like phosphoesterase family protein
MHTMNTFFISDLHLNHGNIIKFCPRTRPYASIEDMNADLIAKWNSVVTNSDTVYFLGDFAFKTKDDGLRSFYLALRGQKHLIVGNHDHTPTRKLPWASVEHYKLLKFGDQKVVLFHYPIMPGQWDTAHYGSILLYGHVHGEPQYTSPVRAFDMGVDAIGPVPLTYEQIKVKADLIPIVHKHHVRDEV